MGYFEFPHTRTYDSDLGWLIEEYKRIAEEVASLNVRVTQNEADIAQLQEDVIAIRREIIDFKREVNERIEAFEAEVRQMFADLEDEVRQELERFEAEIEEQLRIMEERLNVRFEALKNEVEVTLALFREELTQTEEELRAELAQAVADMNYALETGLAEIRSEFNALKEIIDNTLELYDEKIAANLELAKAYTDEREAYLQSEIDEIRIDPTPRVIIPATQTAATIQECFDAEHYFLRAWALRASYYDSVGLTAEAYDAYELRAYDYDYLAKWFLVEKPEVYTMYSPFNGRVEPIKTVITEITTHINSGLTATEYDAKQLTAEAYDLLELTAFEYDFYGSQFIA